MENNIAEVEKIIGYTFRDKKHLRTALTHSSYANEHRVESNERYEFLGDAVLEMVVTEQLFLNVRAREGGYTKMRADIVSEKPLSDIVTSLGLENYLFKGNGESNRETESKAVKCDLFEAIVGALYLDGGYEESKKFILHYTIDSILAFKKTGVPIDNKSKLQEICKTNKPVYTYIKQGEAFAPQFIAFVTINGEKMGKGVAKSKRDAEMIAAGEAIDKLNMLKAGKKK